MLTALQTAKERKSSFVTQLIAAGAAKARDIAIAASAEFGVPLFDLDSHQVDLDIMKLVQDKLVQKHRCLPLFGAASDCSSRWRIRPICTPSTRSNSRPASASRPSSSKTTSCRRPSTRPSSRPTRRCRSSPTTRPDSISRTSTSPAATTTWKARASPATTSKTRPSCASSTSYCSTRSAAAHRTSISNPTKRCTASACASTAC